MNKLNPVSKVTEEDEITEKAVHPLYNPKSDLAKGEALRDRLEFKTVSYGNNKGFGN